MRRRRADSVRPRSISYGVPAARVGDGLGDLRRQRVGAARHERAEAFTATPQRSERPRRITGPRPQARRRRGRARQSREDETLAPPPAVHAHHADEATRRRNDAASASASRASRRRRRRKPGTASTDSGAYQRRPLFGSSVSRRRPVKNGYANVSPPYPPPSFPKRKTSKENQRKRIPANEKSKGHGSARRGAKAAPSRAARLRAARPTEL